MPKKNICGSVAGLNIDVNLLREQRDYLLKCYGEGVEEHIDGIINLLDAILDKCEGFD